MKLSIFTKFFKNNWAMIIVIFVGILASRTLLFQSGYFNMHDDLQMMRQLEMEKCFNDFQIPCRWVPDMGYGYGFPLFNFYPPLPYLIGQVFRVVQFSFVDTVKITFALAFIFSGIAMYLLGKEFFKKWGGVVSAIFYVWAPYHSVDVYVRGAMNETWALVWFPLIFLFSYKLIAKYSLKNSILLSLSWVGLLLSHNLMAMIFAPVFAVWCLIWIAKSKSFWINALTLLKSGLVALGLSAFFTLPAVFEQKYVHVDTLIQGYYEYIAHFATINQLLFSRFWGYGPSVWLTGDGMPFPVGHIHWILSLVIGLSGVIYWYKNRKTLKNKHILYSVFYILLVGWFAVFMAHSRSTFIWQHVKPFAFVQFPWRFLTLVAFSFSFIAGSVVLFTKNKIIPIVLCLVVVAWNWNFFLPQNGKMGPLTDKEKFTGAAWDLQRTAGIFDYLPNTAKENPKDGQNVLAEVVRGKAKINNMQSGTDWAQFDSLVSSESATIRINLFDFPKWKIEQDGKEVEYSIPDTEKWGRMYLEIPEGSHMISLKLQNTPIRTISNIISLLSWIFLGIYLLKLKGGRDKSRNS
jgi:hypothetical protein